MLQKLETILTTAQQSQILDTLTEVVEFYGANFNQEQLQTQLTSLHSNSTEQLKDLQSIVAHLKSLGSVQNIFYSEVVKVIKVILVMPATNAVSERNFSAIRRMKTRLRSTTSQSRLNWCLCFTHMRKEMLCS